MIRGEKRYDQIIVDYLNQRKLSYFDMNLVHVHDYQYFRLSPEEYLRRYLIGHYNPMGNHFFAYAVKDKIVDWLDPKPVTYRSDKSERVNFHGYLPEW